MQSCGLKLFHVKQFDKRLLKRTTSGTTASK
jgi:hypothetical protein